MPTGNSASACGRVELLEDTVAQNAEVVRSLDDHLQRLRDRGNTLESVARELTERADQLDLEVARLVQEVARTEHAATEADRSVERAQHESDLAEQARHRSAARAEALARGLQDLQGAGGRDLLNGWTASWVRWWTWSRSTPAGRRRSRRRQVQLSQRSWSKDARPRRRRWARLRSQGVTAAVPAARTRDRQPPEEVVDRLPGGADPLRPHIRPRHTIAGSDIDGVLDALVGRSVRVAGWEQAIDLSLDRPSSSWSRRTATVSHPPGGASGRGRES